VIPAQIAGLDVIISGGATKWTQRSLKQNTQLLAIHRTGAGYENVDVPALTEACILLTTTPLSAMLSMATSIMTLILALSLRLLIKDKLVREGRWEERGKYNGNLLADKVLGSIGVGKIGKELFRLAKPFQMKHIAITKSMNQEAVDEVGAKLIDMDTLLGESDFLTINCPLNKETYHLIGEKELRKMKKTAFLINTARGPIVNEKAFITALQKGWIQGAALDVFEQEPTLATNPLLSMENVIVAPHAIGWTVEGLTCQWGEVLEQIAQVRRGELPRNTVNQEVWTRPGLQLKLRPCLEST